MTGTKVKHLADHNFEAETAEGVTLVDFWAPWCGPCRMMGPVLDDLVHRLDGEATVAKVNVDEAPSLAHRFGISAIPVLVVLRDGREVKRLVGAQPLTNLLQVIRNT